MPKTTPDNDNEYSLFRESMSDVKRLRTDKVNHDTPKPRPAPEQTRIDQARVMQEILSYDYDASELQPGDQLDYSRPGLQKSVLRKLKKGQYRIEIELDLHGQRAEEAAQSLAEFLTAARNERTRCVRIIHGKGHRSDNQGPVLKPLVSRLLSRRDEVLAFCSARPVDGGTGALYVLLRAL